MSSHCWVFFFFSCVLTLMLSYASLVLVLLNDFLDIKGLFLLICVI